MFPVLVGAIVLIVASGVAAGRTGRGSDGTPARRVADARVADGDLSPARRAQLLTVLDERQPAGGARRVLWLPAAAVVTLIVVLAAVAGVGVNDAGWAGNGTVMAGHMGGNGTGTTTATSAAADAAEATVVAGDLWFQPEAVEIPAGVTVNLTVDNTGAVFHDLTVDSLDLQVDVAAGESATVAVQVDAAGTYEFVCSVPGHAAGGMRGQLTVTGN